MENQNPDPSEEAFAHIFEEMVDLLQLTVDSAETIPTGPLSKDIESKLSKLEKEVDEFCNLNLAITHKARKEMASKPPVDPLEAMTKRERRIFERSKRVVAEAEEKIKWIEKQLGAISAQGSLSSIDHNTEEGRKKLFKRYGLRKKWKML